MQPSRLVEAAGRTGSMVPHVGRIINQVERGAVVGFDALMIVMKSQRPQRWWLRVARTKDNTNVKMMVPAKSRAGFSLWEYFLLLL
jgi:hypothetical protein